MIAGNRVAVLVLLLTSALAAVSFAVQTGDENLDAVQLPRWRYGLLASCAGAAMVLASALTRSARLALWLSIVGSLVYLNWLFPLNVAIAALYAVLYDDTLDLKILRDFNPVIWWIVAAIVAHIIAFAALLIGALQRYRRQAEAALPA